MNEDLFKEDVQTVIDRLKAKSKKMEEDLDKHIEKKEAEIRDNDLEIRMLQEYAQSKESKQPDLVEVGS